MDFKTIRARLHRDYSDPGKRSLLSTAQEGACSDAPAGTSMPSGGMPEAEGASAAPDDGTIAGKD